MKFDKNPAQCSIMVFERGRTDDSFSMRRTIFAIAMVAAAACQHKHVMAAAVNDCEYKFVRSDKELIPRFVLSSGAAAPKM